MNIFQQLITNALLCLIVPRFWRKCVLCHIAWESQHSESKCQVLSLLFCHPFELFLSDFVLKDTSFLDFKHSNDRGAGLSEPVCPCFLKKDK